MYQNKVVLGVFLGCLLARLTQCAKVLVVLISLVSGLFAYSSIAAEPDKLDAEPLALEQIFSVSGAYFRLMPPGRTVSAAFMDLNNRGSEPLILVGLRSDSVERVELHEHSHANGMMQMRELEQLTIAAGGSVALKPGGYHIMLFGLPAGLTGDDSIDIELVFASGKSVIVNAAARSLRSNK